MSSSLAPVPPAPMIVIIITRSRSDAIGLTTV